MVTRKEFIGEARECVGTPYLVGQSRKGLGCDCVGLLMILAKRFDIRFRTEPYVQNPNGYGLIEELREYLDEVDVGDAVPGDILVFWVRTRRVPTHVGILDCDKYFIHASNDVGVVRVCLDARWYERLIACFRVRGIIND